MRQQECSYKIFFKLRTSELDCSTLYVFGMKGMKKDFKVVLFSSIVRMNVLKAQKSVVLLYTSDSWLTDVQKS